MSLIDHNVQVVLDLQSNRAYKLWLCDGHKAGHYMTHLINDFLQQLLSERNSHKANSTAIK